MPKLRLRFIAVTGFVILTGCAGMDYAMSNYSGVPVLQHKHSANTWRIFDKPDENRLMITSSIGQAVAAGAVEGATLGLSGNMTSPYGAFYQAAQSFLDQNRPGCKITTGGLVISPQYEFFYQCIR